MLTKDQATILISIIDILEESPLKNDFLSQLNNLVKQSEESQQKVEPINMKDIHNRFKPHSHQITIKDLQEEIKNLKQEIQLLKENDISLEYRFLELKGKEIIKYLNKQDTHSNQNYIEENNA